MQAGRLRHQVTLETQSTILDTFGEESNAWTATATVWASIEPISGRERLLASGTQADITHRIRMRYRSGVAPRMRVTFGTRHFDIVSVANREERNRELELMCQELV
jgi:SPP1 family predicted phage head-tail adaptor